MELNEKLKSARIYNNISQKEAADKIGVSRQTFSNWETGKTYPDIANLIKLSELYSISLDDLLKGKEKSSAYVDYIDKAIAVIKNKQKIYKILEISVYLLILIVYLIMYFSSYRDLAAYTMNPFLIPTTIVIISLLIGIDKAWGKNRWFLILFFGITYGLAQQFTVYYNTLPEIGVLYDVIRIFNPANYSAGAFISFIGLGIGALARKFSDHSDEENEK